MIKTVTLTGADDSILPEQLVEISRLYPFVEWGILVSRSSTGQVRFPSMPWIKELVRLQDELIISNKKPMNLSMHLCGSYVREILTGVDDFVLEKFSGIFNSFARVQINTHGEPHLIHDSFYETLLEYPHQEFIFQYDNVNGKGLTLAYGNGVKCSALFDLSHGAGILPEQWPEILPEVKCGYAGGLSPENLLSQIEAIERMAGENPIWIDMETHLFSNGGRVFDLLKCRKVLEIAKPYINQLPIGI